MRQGWEVGVWPRADPLEQGLEGSGQATRVQGRPTQKRPSSLLPPPRTAHLFSAGLCGCDGVVRSL